MEETKECSKCKRILPIENFGRRKDSKDGHCGQCKYCIADRKLLWRKAHPNYFKEYHIEHRSLKPKVVKTCPHCGKEFETSKPHQRYCKTDCKPVTPIRQLKQFLIEHPEIDRKEFFKERYKARYKGRYVGRYKEKDKQYKASHREQIRIAKRKYRTNKRLKSIFQYGVNLP